MSRTLHEWRWVGGSVSGTSHVRADVPCQDASLIRVAGDTADGQTLVLVCADGAGSAAMSERGSWLAVHSLAASVANCIAEGRRVADLTEHDLARWFREAAWQLQMEADAEARPVRDYACTLLCAVIDGEAAVYAQLGDGVIVAGHQDDIAPVFWPQQGEFANTTFFITAPEHLERVQVRTAAEVPERVALMSDGLQNLALRMAERAAHPGFFGPLFRDLLRHPKGEVESLREPLRNFLDSPRVNARTDDDKTLLLAVREVPGQDLDVGITAPAADDQFVP